MNSDIGYLLSPKTVRDRAHQMLDFALSGRTHFEVHLEKLDLVANYVLEVIKENYPSLEIPFHSRKNHLNAGAILRTEKLNQAIKAKNPKADLNALGRAQFDLVVVSVLLDAGAGDTWQYKEASSGKFFSRSEGLAVASFDMFMLGYFSSDQNNPYQVDANGLRVLNEQVLMQCFQVSDANPLLGVSGRLGLLKSLGQVLAAKSDLYPQGKLSGAFDFLTAGKQSVSALDVLQFVLTNWGEIWPSRIRMQGMNLGDVWSYSGFGSQGSLESMVPFHKLSQWLTYSLLVPMMEAGFSVKEVEKMTGLPEYRNGGLLIDLELLSLKNKSLLLKKHKPDEDLIIEWRGLTVALLDKIGERVQKMLHKTPEEMPLAKVLEGGTWQAGRKIAKQLRAGGVPPLNIDSDGTVF